MYSLITASISTAAIMFILVFSNALGQPTPSSSFVAKASTNIIGAESFYAFHIRLVGSGTAVQLIDTIEITFPVGFDVSDARLITAFGTPTLTKKVPGTLIFKYNPPANTNFDGTFLVDGIKNSLNVGDSEILLSAFRNQGLVFGPMKSTISTASISASTIAEDAITARELAGVTKILFFNCGFTTLFETRAAHGTNFENLGWVTIPGFGGADCQAQGVEEGDLVLISPAMQGIVIGIAQAHNDFIRISFNNYHPFPINEGGGFRVPLIVFKK